MELNQLAQELDLADVTQLLTLVVNKDAEESDSLVIKLNNAELRIKELEAENAKLTGIADQSEIAISNLEERHNSLMEATKQAIDKKEYALANLELELKAFKEAFGTPKKGREKIKRLQKANEALNKKCDQLLRNNKEYSRENFELKKNAVSAQFGETVVSAMESVCWEHDGEYLMLFHRQMARNSKENYSPALLYISPTGSASMVMLEDDEPVLSRQPRGGHKPKAETSKFAKQWLTKVKAQKGIVKSDDLDALKNNMITETNKKAA